MIEFVLKASIALLVFYTFYQAFLAKESMFRFNRFFLISALCFSLIVPFFPMPLDIQVKEKLLPEVSLSEIISQSDSKINENPIQMPVGTSKAIDETFSAESSFSVNWKMLGFGVYMLGLCFFLARFIFQLNKLFRSIRDNESLKSEECTYVLLPKNTLPFTFLHFLFVEKSAFQSQAIEQEIIYHELTHIRQKHTWDILFIELLKIVFWFNPLLLFYKKAIQLNHEYLADEAVVSKFNNKAAYQWLLFHKIPGNEAAYSMSSPFNYSVTRRRVIMMGQISSIFKARLYKTFSLFLAGLVLIVLSSNKPSSSVQFNSTTESEFEQILAKAFKDGNPYELDISKLDLPALKMAYLQMDEQEINKSTEFPFFEDLTYEKLEALQQAYPEVKTTILYNRPPVKNQIPQDVYELWKNYKNISLTIDDVEKDIADLESYQPEDFSLFKVVEISKKELFKKGEYEVSLITNEFYKEKYLKGRKSIQLIQAEYPDEYRVLVSFMVRHGKKENGQTVEDLLENYYASIFHQLRVINPSQKPSDNEVIGDGNGFGIAIMKERKPTFYLRLPFI